jgi:hypothetical protein
MGAGGRKAVSEETQDRALTHLFQEVFGLDREQEDAFWQELEARRAQEVHSWAAFRSVMIQAGARVQRAIAWSAWPARGLPGIG